MVVVAFAVPVVDNNFVVVHIADAVVATVASENSSPGNYFDDFYSLCSRMNIVVRIFQLLCRTQILPLDIVGTGV